MRIKSNVFFSRVGKCTICSNDDLVHFGSGGDKKGLKKYFFGVRGFFCHTGLLSN